MTTCDICYEDKKSTTNDKCVGMCKCKPTICIDCWRKLKKCVYCHKTLYFHKVKRQLHGTLYHTEEDGYDTEEMEEEVVYREPTSLYEFIVDVCHAIHYFMEEINGQLERHHLFGEDVEFHQR